MLKAYKYRIYPNKEQTTFFEKTFGACRFVWNLMLEEKLKALENKEKIPRITPAKYKAEYTFLREVDSFALCNVQLNLEKAFKNWFRNPKQFGKPAFKRKRDKQTYTTNNNNSGSAIKIDFKKGLMHLPKIKDIKIRLHRKLSGRIKSVTVSKTKTGKYYASILVETENVQTKTKEPKSKICGIDLGIKNFATIMNDFSVYKVEHPRHLLKAEKRLIRLQRKLSKKQKGSRNREKAILVLAKYHEYVTNAIKDFLHKLSKAIIDENQVVVVEDLGVKGLMQSFLAKHIADSGWRMFLQFLDYKARWYGRQLLTVDRYYPSSKTCSECGHVYSDMNLSVREWTCPACGVVHDRDENASKNLYKHGVAHLTSGRDGIARTHACGECKALDEAGSLRLYKRG